MKHVAVKIALLAVVTVPSKSISDCEGCDSWLSFGQLDFERLSTNSGVGRSFSIKRAPNGTLLAFDASDIHRRVVIVPGVGIFYKGFDASDCAPDHAESLGLYTLLPLGILNAASDSVPAQDGVMTLEFAETSEPHTVSFLGGTMTWKPPWSVSGSASRVSDRVEFEFELEMARGGSALFRGVWEAAQAETAIDASTPLDEWHTCWSETWSDSHQGFQAEQDLYGQPSLLTFGDIFDAMPDNQSSNLHSQPPPALRPDAAANQR